MHQTKSDLCGVKRHISKNIFGKKRGEIETVVTNTNWPQYISNNDSQLPMLPALPCPAPPASQPANVQTNRSPVHSRSVQTETNFCAILQAPPNQRTSVKKFHMQKKQKRKERKQIMINSTRNTPPCPPTPQKKPQTKIPAYLSVETGCRERNKETTKPPLPNKPTSMNTKTNSRSNHFLYPRNPCHSFLQQKQTKGNKKRKNNIHFHRPFPASIV